MLSVVEELAVIIPIHEDVLRTPREPAETLTRLGGSYGKKLDQPFFGTDKPTT
jgi:hypothetical protein